MVFQDAGPDNPGEFALLLVVAILVTGLIALRFPSSPAHVRFMVRDVSAYLSTPEADLVFSQRQVNQLNDISADSLGVGPLADERQFCFQVTNHFVINVDQVHHYEDASQTHVEGSCRQTFDEPYAGFIHTHPGFHEDPSEEDKDIEADLRYSCIIFDEIVQSPSGKVSGINCWYAGENELLVDQPAEVAISG